MTETRLCHSGPIVFTPDAPTHPQSPGIFHGVCSCYPAGIVLIMPQIRFGWIRQAKSNGQSSSQKRSQARRPRRRIPLLSCPQHAGNIMYVVNVYSKRNEARAHGAIRVPRSSGPLFFPQRVPPVYFFTDLFTVWDLWTPTRAHVALLLGPGSGATWTSCTSTILRLRAAPRRQERSGCGETRSCLLLLNWARTRGRAVRHIRHAPPGRPHTAAGR